MRSGQTRRLRKRPDNTQHGRKACVPHSRDTDGDKSRTSPDGRGCSRDRRAPSPQGQEPREMDRWAQGAGPMPSPWARSQNLQWALKMAQPAGQR